MSKKKKKPKQQRSLEDIRLQKDRIRKHVPSENWAEAVVMEGERFPPQADSPSCQMRPCLSETCNGKCYPFMYVDNGLCYECHLYQLPKSRLEALPRSNSIVRF